MTDAPNGWPDPLRPGVPANPEKDAPHWFRDKATGDVRALMWRNRDFTQHSLAEVARRYDYLGPCHTPAEVAAREAAAQAMREACARRVDDDGIGDPRERQLRAYLAGQVRALPIPAPAALAREIAAAEARGMEKAAGIAAANGNEPTQRNLTDYQAGGRDMADTIAAAIRAMAEEAGDE